MKKFFYSILAFGLTACMASCMEVDNFDQPEASIHGRLIDATTGENYLTDQGDVHIRIWEKSYSDNPNPQDLNIKMDGTYNRLHLFAGTYDMLPYDGSWWPCDTTYDVPIGNKNNALMDFKVMPYLKIKDYKCELKVDEKTAMDTIIMSGRLFAPRIEGLPQGSEVRPFLNNNQYCGAANHIDYYYTDRYKKSLLTFSWEDILDVETGEGMFTYEFRLPVKPGYTYWCRMGAKVKDDFEKFNYSEIVKIEVPMR